jgi:hypothetical protein
VKAEAAAAVEERAEAAAADGGWEAAEEEVGAVAEVGAEAVGLVGLLAVEEGSVAGRLERLAGAQA